MIVTKDWLPGPFASVLLFACVLSGGCAPTIYSDAEVGKTAASISAKSTWRAFGDFRDPQKAVDGNLDTAATTAASYDNAKLTIDLGKRCLFNMIIIDHGPGNENAFCRRVGVQVSYDGVTFRQVYATSGTRRITYCTLITPTRARYVRLAAIVPGDRPWSIAEVYLQ